MNEGVKTLCNWRERDKGGVFVLFHVTTGKKAKQYRQTGHIHAPVRGFDTLISAMAWAMKTGRKVILRIESVTEPRMLPDHHNEFGNAWWTEAVPIDRVKCAYSAEGAWNEAEQPPYAHPSSLKL